MRFNIWRFTFDIGYYRGYPWLSAELVLLDPGEWFTLVAVRLSRLYFSVAVRTGR